MTVKSLLSFFAFFERSSLSKKLKLRPIIFVPMSPNEGKHKSLATGKPHGNAFIFALPLFIAESTHGCFAEYCVDFSFESQCSDMN